MPFSLNNYRHEGSKFLGYVRQIYVRRNYDDYADTNNNIKEESDTYIG
jgi:hypothetical protein